MSENRNTQLWNPEQRAFVHYNSPKWKQMDFPLDTLRSKSASVSNAPLSLSRRFSPVFQFIGETTHTSQGSLRWFPGASGSIQSHWWQTMNRAMPMAVLRSISLSALWTRVGLGRRGEEQTESVEGCWGEGGEKSWEKQRSPRRRLQNQGFTLPWSKTRLKARLQTHQGLLVFKLGIIGGYPGGLVTKAPHSQC